MGDNYEGSSFYEEAMQMYVVRQLNETNIIANIIYFLLSLIVTLHVCIQLCELLRDFQNKNFPLLSVDPKLRKDLQLCKLAALHWCFYLKTSAH